MKEYDTIAVRGGFRPRLPKCAVAAFGAIDAHNDLVARGFHAQLLSCGRSVGPPITYSHL
jgi:hypothetical protein